MMTTPDGSSGAGESGLGEAANPSGSANGAMCAANSDCQSGFCTDGVCCNKACAGTCEACNLTGSGGTCTGIPANTDPQMECVTVSADGGVPLAATDASNPDSGDAGINGDTGTVGDAGSAGDAASASDAGDAGGDAAAVASINFPDGGYTSSNTPCAGACDGKGGNGGGSGVYPGSTISCGTQFCNEPYQAAGFVCNGGGSCSLGTPSCTAYSCVGSACGTTCTVQSDCLTGYYCNTGTGVGKCVPTFGNGTSCTSPSECTSGYCTTGSAPTQLSPVCCSTACTIPGGTCVVNPGQCQCNVTCSTGGSCQLYYRDYDGDGYGDINGAVGTMSTDGTDSAYVGCSNDVTPKPGYVADHTDCDDLDARAHPGQTAYFGTPMIGISPPSYDFDCDGLTEKATPEFPGASCEFCNTTPTCAASATTCATAGDQATFGCGPRCYIRLCLRGEICPPLCVTCTAIHDSGFPYTVPCGDTSTTTTCGTCAAAGDGAGTGTANTYTTSVQQLCH
jgi:hypothetical protein